MVSIILQLIKYMVKLPTASTTKIPSLHNQSRENKAMPRNMPWQHVRRLPNGKVCWIRRISLGLKKMPRTKKLQTKASIKKITDASSIGMTGGLLLRAAVRKGE